MIFFTLLQDKKNVEKFFLSHFSPPFKAREKFLPFSGMEKVKEFKHIYFQRRK